MLSDSLKEMNSKALLAINRENLDANIVNAFERYIAALKPSLDRYRHHLSASKVSENLLLERFLYESVILQHLTLVIAEKIFRATRIRIMNWAVNDVSSPFSWYIPNTFIHEQISNLNDEILEEELETSTTELITEVLGIVSKRYAGEYYTPLPLAKHLVDVSGFDVAKFRDTRIVDPACGGGVVLNEIIRRVIFYSIENDVETSIIINWIDKNLFGFDIQPFAIILTNTFLKYTLITSLPLENTYSYLDKITTFANVCLLDPLANPKKFWDSDISFDFIIGNPPYMSSKKAYLDYIDHYEDVLYGHPNLYQLFIWWAVKASTSGGKIAYLLPQSMLIGLYFKQLRHKLVETVKVKHLTRFLDRKGIVGDADQQMMVVGLEVTSYLHDELLQTTIDVKVARNSRDLENTPLSRIPYNYVIQEICGEYIWVVSDEMIDYEIGNIVNRTMNPLQDFGAIFSVGNGNFVWNQHKERLVDAASDKTIPLISAASVSLFSFDFPYAGSHASGARPYAKYDDDVYSKLHAGNVILLQRTTPRKVGRRIVATMLPEIFLTEHDSYFIENHIIYIKSSMNDLLYGLLGWLNSDIVNFVFQMRNGTVHTSVSEITSLPVNLEVLENISPIVREILVLKDQNEKVAYISELNNTVNNLLGLSQIQVDRIQQVLNRTERVRD